MSGSRSESCHTSSGSAGAPSCTGGKKAWSASSATTSASIRCIAAAVCTRLTPSPWPSAPLHSVSSSSGTPGRSCDAGRSRPAGVRSAATSPARAASDTDSGQRRVSRQ
ncbi:hypothetical protein WY02_16320 [Pseudonocardia sp. AL041005-10]|nr:hypothetical protein [Pseudonocardia sp. AL041005-10]ALE79737.1 hypothetical protein WY02_16320 [Pseudonocardia sp. AL041005-10]